MKLRVKSSEKLAQESGRFDSKITLLFSTIILLVLVSIGLLAGLWSHSNNQSLFPINKSSIPEPSLITRVPDERSEAGLQVTYNFLSFLPIIKNGAQGALQITNVTDNRAEYPGSKIPNYEKLEITFLVPGTVAQNFQFPYDPSPPNGIDLTYPPHQGISVDAHFTPDNWQTVYQQPAFYYQYFDEDIREEGNGQKREWYGPTDHFAWKVRFSPNQTGRWQYRLVAQDASGYVESPSFSFDVTESSNRGFIKVSQSDGRYFEYDEGGLFFPLGFQGIGRYTVDALADPVQVNEPAYQTYSQNGINLIRIWISGMYGAAWLQWLGGRNLYDGYLPRPGIVPFYDPVRDRYTMTQLIDYEPEGDTGQFDGCRFQFWDYPEAVKPHTNYRLRIKYWGEEISGPRNASYPEYGLVGKIGGGWEVDCFEPGTSSVITNYGTNTSDWDYVEGIWNSEDNYFLDTIYIGLENVTQGRAYIDSISLQEDLGDGQYGPEIIAEPSMEYELYIPEQRAHALDKLVELAEVYGLSLKLVIQEKNDKIYRKLDDDGTFVFGEEEDNSDGFYGLGRDSNKTRWLQQAWWRYLQARWGYSTAVHSWELTNEGDPWSSDHWALTDEFGKFMHCRVFGISVGNGDGQACGYDHPNDHLVTTSFWHSFPGESFWASLDYPNVDYADVHAYVSTGWRDNPVYEADAALFHLDYSSEIRGDLDTYSEQNGIPTKPLVRGETGIDFLDEQEENPDLALDLQGVWLHNLIWASLDPGAMTELYWWGDQIENQPGPDGQPGLYEVYKYLGDFVQDIPLANGFYQDAEATLTDSNLRVTGQKDTHNGRTHIWVQNKNHTWRNVVDGVDGISGLSGTLTLEGFAPQTQFDVEWHHFTTQGMPSIHYSSMTSNGNGEIVLNLPTDPQITDVGIKIGDY